MASRFPPRDRDRTPPRYTDRRPPPNGPGSRGAEDANSTPLGREPPRGPKALVDSPRGGPFGAPPSRGRGFGGRGGDFRDRDRDRDRDSRDSRDSRDAPPFRRDAERDRPRRDRGFDTKDNRGQLYGRGRSRSPLPLRDFRDSREGAPRDPDAARPRRNSRDGPIGAGASGPEPSSFRGGPVRGRGRGERERGRGRGAPPVDDRDLFRRRSRSRDSWRERDRDHEQRDRFDNNRREDDRRPERDERERHIVVRSDSWREHKPSEMPPPPNILPPSSSSSLPPSTQPKTTSDDHHDTDRKLSQSTSSQRRLSELHEARPSLPERVSDDRPSQQFSPPPPAPEVPAFGSIQGQEISAPIGPSSEARPPTGPKADRLDSQNSADFRPGRPPNKAELSLRPHRPAPSSSESLRQDQLDHAASPQGSGRPPSRVKTPDAVPQRTSQPPSGSRPRSSGSPSAASPSLVWRPSSSAHDGTPPQQLQSTPLASPGMSFASVPTGPRALQRSGPPNSGPKAGNQWSRPSISSNQEPRGPPSAPSIPPARRDSRSSSDDNFAKPSLSDNLELPDEMGQVQETQPTKHPPGVQGTNVDAADLVDSKEDIDAQPLAEQSEAPFLFAESAGEESDEEDALDEEDFNRSEERFKKEIQSLNAEMPLPLLKDPVMVGLLLKIQMLTMIAEGAVPRYLDMPGAAMEIERPHQPPTILPLSSKDAKEIDLSEAPPSGDSKPPEAAVDLLSVESLPFLQSGPPTPFSDMESLQETMKSHEQVKDALREVLGKQRAETSSERERLRKQYAQYYRPWKAEVTEMDRKKEESKPEVAPPTPPPPVTNPPPVLEGRRGLGRLNSELDFQNALKASAITAEEESARRRDKEASAAKPDMTKEAPIPDMLEPRARDAAVFQDTNQIIDTTDALKVLGFCPPPNDFTPMEHKMFTDAFMDYPKKWGKIAESLPGRTFQQCVTHYYLTKEEIKYKAKLNRRWTSRKGRGRKAVRPAKTGALMADLGASRPEYDGGGGGGGGGADVEQSDMTPAVTDSGRPRRAAAPTFGDSNDAPAESSAPTPNSGKRGSSNQTKDPGTSNGSEATNAAERQNTTSRRGRGGASRAGRRQRAQQPQQPQPIATIAAAPPKQEVGLPSEKEVVAADTAAATAGTSGTSSMLKDNKDELDKDMAGYAPRGKTNRARAKEPAPGHFGNGAAPAPATATAAAAAAGAGGGLESAGSENLSTNNDAVESGARYGSLQPTSYWSVHEQRDFPDLVSHYGKDYVGISQFMKTKTPTMVKNYFQRQISSGKTELEELALIAETKKIRGEPTAPLPTPSAIPKRRYEATPSAIGPRPLAPNTDAEGPDRSLAPKGKSAVAGQGAVGAPPSIQARPSVERDRVPPRYQPLAPQATAGGHAAAAPTGALYAGGDDAQSPSMNPQAAPPQRVPQGPRMGYFSSDDRRDIRQHVVQEPLDGKQHPPYVAGVHVQNGMGGMPAAADTSRRNIVSRPQDVQEPVRYQQLPQSAAYAQTGYMHTGQPAVPPASSPHTHSRRTSRTLPTSAASPIQQPQLHPPKPGTEVVPPPELLSKPVSGYLPPGPSSDIGRPPAAPPPNETSRSNSTPAQSIAEPPSQVPAKRSNRLNIMSILNEESEEPQPRKRFASEQSPAPAKVPGGFQQPRPVYTGTQPTSQQQPTHPDGPGPAAQQQHSRTRYAPSGAQPQALPQTQQNQQHLQQRQPQQHVEPVRQYPEQQQQQQQQPLPPPPPPHHRHPSFSTASGPRGSASQDWLARFDPRGQQPTQQAAAAAATSTTATGSSSDHHLPRLSTQQPAGHAYGASSASQASATQQSPSHPLPLQNQQQQQHTQRQPTQHQPLQQSRQVPAIHTQGHQPHGSRGAAGRESPITQPLQTYQPSAGSPVQRHHSISYSMRGLPPGSSSPIQAPVAGVAQPQYQQQQPRPVGGYVSDSRYDRGQGQDQQQQHPQALAGPVPGQHSAHESHSSTSYGHVPIGQQLAQQEQQPPLQTQRRSSLGGGTIPQQQPQSVMPFGRASPPPSHVQPIPRHGVAPVRASGPAAAPPNLSAARPYSPPQPMAHHHRQAHSQTNIGGGGMPYPGSGGTQPPPGSSAAIAAPPPPPHGVAQQHHQQQQQQNVPPAHPLHIQPRQSGAGSGPGMGGHGGYPHDPPR